MATLKLKLRQSSSKANRVEWNRDWRYKCPQVPGNLTTCLKLQLLILPEMCLCLATLQIPWFIVLPFNFLNTLPNPLVAGGSCDVPLLGWSISLVSVKSSRALSFYHSNQHCSKETAPSAWIPHKDDMGRPPANPQWTMEHEWEINLHCFKPKPLRFEVRYCGIAYPILTDTLPFLGGRSRWILLGVGNSAQQRERTRSPSFQPHHHASEKPSAVGRNEP